MEYHSNSNDGFTLIEVLITVALVGIIAAIAIPSYNDYTTRGYYSEIVRATAPYKVAVDQCAKNLGGVAQCDAGTNNIPPAITTSNGAVASITTSSGVITATPVTAHGITAADTYILTPTMKANGTLGWASSGGGVTAGYAR